MASTLRIVGVLLLVTVVIGLAPPPEPSTGLHLKLVVSLFRHGDRSPLYSWPADVLPLSNWPDGAGQLTPVGIRAHYELGTRIRRHYIDDLKFISPSYRRSEIYIRSTDIDRTLMSAYSHMAGLYPKGSASLDDVSTSFVGDPLQESQVGLPGKVQPVPIHTAPRLIDGLLVPGGACPRHDKLQAEKRKSSEWAEKEKEAYETLKKLTRVTKSKMPLRLWNASGIADTWTVQRAHKIPLPEGADKMFDRAVQLSQWTQNFTNAGVEARRLRAGLLLHEISKRARVAVAAQAGTSSPDVEGGQRKYVVFSAHDTTVASALAALDMFDGVNPPYNSTLIWEVYTRPNGADTSISDAVVRVVYNGKPLLLPGCHGQKFCPLDVYLESTKAVTVASTTMRTRECLTGAERLGADLMAWFVHDAHDADDVPERPHSGSTWIAWLLSAALLVGASMAVHAYRTRYAGYSSDLWNQSDEDRMEEQRVRKTFGEANAGRAILM